MGLSSKLVSVDDNWSCSQNSVQEAPQTKPEPLKCPRCDSINTKFCYYNNYNKSQPRHFCKGCKRHWTEGGTLRNVPVGGGRKNKRPRPVDASERVTLEVNDHKCLLNTSTHQMFVPLMSNTTTIMDEEKKEFHHQTLDHIPSSSLPYDLNTQFSNFSTIGTLPNSTTPSSNVYEYKGNLDSSMEESTTTTAMPITSSSLMPWKLPETSNFIENMPSNNYWNWNEIDTLSTADLNIPWDDLEINP